MANSYETDMRAAVLALMTAREALERAGEYAFTDIADKLLEDVSDRLHDAKIEAEYDKPNLSDADAASISAAAQSEDDEPEAQDFEDHMTHDTSMNG